MNLEKAIEILKELERHSSLAFSPDELDSIKLGLEALKYVKNQRHDHLLRHDELLSGEYEE